LRKSEHPAKPIVFYQDTSYSENRGILQPLLTVVLHFALKWKLMNWWTQHLSAEKDTEFGQSFS